MSSSTDPEHLEELLSGLNEPQREAVIHGEGPLLILAGAGSGKTRVLAHRIAYLMFSGRAEPNEILAITFTNKAAQEMRERVEQLLGSATRGMWLMTFHAACARILRSEAPRLGYTRQFTIYDQADARRLVKRCLDELGIDVKRFTPAALQSQISAAKSKLCGPAECAQAAGSQFEEIVGEVYALYDRELMRMNAMDFDDLLMRTVNLLELFDEVRERYASAFRYVLVDEYQDTNRAQYRLLSLLVDGGRDPARGDRHRNLAVVGDDAQSIYGFRGADVRNILDFQKDYPDAHVVKLEQNYRSTQTILTAANALIANNRGGISKRLWSDLGSGDPIHLRELDDEHGEARFVVGEIERLLDGGAGRAEIAVFYRTNAMSRVLEDALVRHEIAYQVIGGTKFYERAEIKDAIAYLTLLSNPQDQVSFQRVANSPRRGVGQTSLARLLAHASTQDISVWEAAAEPERVPGLGPAAVKALARFMDTMGQLRARLDSGATLGQLLEDVLERTGYVQALQAERTIEAQGRIENLEQLVQVGHEFDGSGESGPDALNAFLQEVALVADADTRRDDEGMVTLMTLHNAKGLEYPIVFIVGCEDGVFPHSRALEEGALEEERRLFYVGVTRAMAELYLTRARRRVVFGAPVPGLPSRFLREIPAELIDEPPVRAGFGSTGRLGASVQPRIASLELLAARGGSGGRPPVGLVAHGRSRQRPGGGGGQSEWAAASSESAHSVAFRLGEDVVHASFGDGVITGVEPGGIIVVRFAGDGSERKLMADYAPVSRR